MLRRLGGCAVALALLLPTQATASTPSSPDARADAAVTKSRTVKLGHQPVRATTATKVRLTFKGRKGQLVNLARIDVTEQCGGRTLRSGGKTVKPWAQGFWRLPRTGTYTAINKPCHNRDTTSLRLQVRQVKVHERLEPDAQGYAFGQAGSSTKVTHLVPFRVGDAQVALLWGTLTTLIRPDRSITRDIDAVDSAYSVRDYPGPVQRGVPSPRGTYFVELLPTAKVSLQVVSSESKLIERTVELDGPPVIIPKDKAAYLTFTGQAGQWVYAEITSAANGEAAYGHRMYNVLAGRDYFLPAVQTGCPGSGPGSCMVTQLPASGTYVVSVALSPGDDLDVSVRVRSALRAAPATVDGPPVSLTATSPGQWVVSDLPELPRDASGGSGVTMTASNASSSLKDWRVRAVSGYGPCNPGFFNECFDINAPANAFTLTASAPTSPMPWDAFANQAVAVLAVAPDATGSLDLDLTRPPSGS